METRDPGKRQQGIYADQKQKFKIYYNVLDELSKGSWQECPYSYSVKHQTIETVLDVIPENLSMAVFTEIAKAFKNRLEAENIFGVHEEVEEQVQPAGDQADLDSFRETIDEIYGKTSKMAVTDNMNSEGDSMMDTTPVVSQNTLTDYTEVVQGMHETDRSRKRKRNENDIIEEMEDDNPIKKHHTEFLTSDYTARTIVATVPTRQSSNSPEFIDPSKSKLTSVDSVITSEHSTRQIILDFVNAKNSFDLDIYLEKLRKLQATKNKPVLTAAFNDLTSASHC